MEFEHIPVLLNECLDGLNIKPDGIYIDGTCGGAGHSAEIAKRLQTGRLIGIDRDPDAVKTASESLKNYNAVVQERDVAVTNSNELYLSLQKALDQQAQSETTAVIYREVLRQRGGIPLAVQHIAIKTLPENAFEYQLDLVQVSPSKRAASGTVELRLIRGTEVLVVPLEDKNFNFENYERLTGRWTMPKGFTPQFIEVRLTGSTPVTRRFSWSRGEAVESQSAFVSEIPQAEANAQ